ncbi:MAG: DMT family transporter [Deltaproteobacteria bacterium]|nr:DMT family transporter [Deltaproteobacteria bacterium]
MPLLLLILFQLFWSSTYTAMKLCMIDMPLGMVMIFRYGFASLGFLVLGQLRLGEKFSPKEWGLIVMFGVLNFSGSPYLQLKSLTLTTAGDIAVMVSFEPLVVALLAVFILKEKLHWTTLITFFVATTGVLIMSGFSGGTHALAWQRLWGDAVFLLSVLFEGLTSIAGKRLTQKHNPARLMAWLVLVGFVANTLMNFEYLSSASLAKISWTSYALTAYMGIFCTTIAYGGWFILLKNLPVVSLSLSLFLQPIFGLVLAVIVLGEVLTPSTLFGSCLVLASLLIWNFQKIQNKLYSSN